ncbi:MAG: ribosome biogenesis GTP-binding protein YihA/YsxC [Ruminiclostridium sp.]
MIIKNAEHEITAVKPNQYPETGFPEVAFVGRSNVGKSSIINVLLNRKKLARVAGTPGKTRQINFYNVNQNFYLVDLPGYGFANVSKDMKASWENIIETYLYSRKQTNLRLVVLLLDIRHSPSKDDIIMHQWIRGFGLESLIIATKADKITRSQINVRINDIRKVLELDKLSKIIPFSSLSRIGKEDILDEIEKCLNMTGKETEEEKEDQIEGKTIDQIEEETID